MASPTNPIINFNFATYNALKAAEKIVVVASDVSPNFRTVTITSFDPDSGAPIQRSGWASLTDVGLLVASLQTQLDNASALLADMQAAV